MYDRIIVQEIIKEMAGMQQINSAQQKLFKGSKFLRFYFFSINYNRKG